MYRVDAAFDDLEVVRVDDIFADVAVQRWDACPLKIRQLGWRAGGSHVYPDESSPLTRRVRGGCDLGPEIALRWLGRHVDALSGEVKLPAVIDTTQPIFLIAAEEE